MADRSGGEVSLGDAWRFLSHRLAVAAGSLVALISLFHHVPVSTASMRGAAAFLAVLLLAKLGLFALERSIAFDSARDSEEQDSTP